MLTCTKVEKHGARTVLANDGERIAQGLRRTTVLAVTVCMALGALPSRVCAQSQSPEVREKVTKATVMVRTAMSEKTKGDKPLGYGSGFFINRTGLCISNDHVVNPSHGKPRWQQQKEAYLLYNRLVWTVVVDSGTEDEKEHEAFVLYRNDRADQAILQVHDEDGDYLETPNFLHLRAGRSLDVGLKAWCYGFPGAEDRKEEGSDAEHPRVAVSEGHIVNMPRRPDGDIKMIVLDVLVDPGNSGGPMVDISGDCIGTATLKPPSEYAGRATQSALVPADLTREFVNLALRRGKLGSNIDLEPFYTLLEGLDGYMYVPGLVRQQGVDCMIVDDGLKICGAPEGESITLPTPLGESTLPCAQMAYLLKQDDERGIILMGGGQRLPFFRDEGTLRFKPSGGNVIEQDLSEVDAVIFRKGKKAMELPATEKSYHITGTEYNLSLLEVEGQSKFSTNLGFDMSLSPDKIRRIETRDGTQVVHTTDGTVVSGQFNGDSFKAVLSINRAPQKISLERAEKFDIEVFDPKAVRQRGLAEIMTDTIPDLIRLAETFDNGDAGSVRAGLERYLKPEYFDKQGTLRKDQLRLLDGACAWAEGKVKEAERQFKKLQRSRDDGIKWYARAYMAVLERYPDAKFNGKPMSEPAVFAEAGAIVADEYLRRALEVLTEREAPTPENRLMFMRLKKKFDNSADELRIASRLDNPKADWAMMQVWNYALDVLHAEHERLEKEKQKKMEEYGQLPAPDKPKGRRMKEEIETLEKHQEYARQLGEELFLKAWEVGFIIDDPDIDIGPPKG